MKLSNLATIGLGVLVGLATSAALTFVSEGTVSLETQRPKNDPAASSSPSLPASGGVSRGSWPPSPSTTIDQANPGGQQLAEAGPAGSSTTADGNEAPIDFHDQDAVERYLGTYSDSALFSSVQCEPLPCVATLLHPRDNAPLAATMQSDIASKGGHSDVFASEGRYVDPTSGVATPYTVTTVIVSARRLQDDERAFVRRRAIVEGYLVSHGTHVLAP